MSEEKSAANGASTPPTKSDSAGCAGCGGYIAAQWKKLLGLGAAIAALFTFYDQWYSAPRAEILAVLPSVNVLAGEEFKAKFSIVNSGPVEDIPAILHIEHDPASIESQSDRLEPGKVGSIPLDSPQEVLVRGKRAKPGEYRLKIHGDFRKRIFTGSAAGQCVACVWPKLGVGTKMVLTDEVIYPSNMCEVAFDLLSGRDCKGNVVIKIVLENCGTTSFHAVQSPENPDPFPTAQNGRAVADWTIPVDIKAFNTQRLRVMLKDSQKRSKDEWQAIANKLVFSAKLNPRGNDVP